MKQNHFTLHDRSNLSLDEAAFADPGLRALWLMQVDTDCASFSEELDQDPNSERTSSKREGGLDKRASASGIRPAKVTPMSDHLVDPWLDESLRLLALDTLQKQLVVIRHIMA